MYGSTTKEKKKKQKQNRQQIFSVLVSLFLLLSLFFVCLRVHNFTLAPFLSLFSEHLRADRVYPHVITCLVKLLVLLYMLGVYSSFFFNFVDWLFSLSLSLSAVLFLLILSLLILRLSCSFSLGFIVLSLPKFSLCFHSIFSCARNSFTWQCVAFVTQNNVRLQRLL